MDVRQERYLLMAQMSLDWGDIYPFKMPDECIDKNGC